MKTSALIMVAVASSLLLVASPSAAYAGTPTAVVPEPAAILVWAGLAGAGGVTYWLRNRRQG